MSVETHESTVSSRNTICENTIKKVLLKDKGHKANLLSWTSTNFTKAGDNNASSVWRVEVEYQLKGQTLKSSYVAKVNPQRTNIFFDDMIHCLFTKESLFYTNLLPELNKMLENVGHPHLNLPRCFHSNLDICKEQIYLEDLKGPGFQPFTNKEGFDEIHTTLILKELARLHASSVLLQEKNAEPLEVKHNFLPGFAFALGDWCDHLTVPPYMKALSTSVEMLQANGGYEKAIIWVEKLKDQLQDILKKKLKNYKFHVVCHGDCWKNNILFRYDIDGSPMELMFLDLQNCRKASLAEDLQYFLYTSVDPGVRQGNVREFLSCYYAYFQEVMDAGGHKMPFTQEEVMQEFWQKIHVGATFGLLHIPIQLFGNTFTPEDEDEGEVELAFPRMVEKATDMAKSQLPSNKLLRKLFFGLIDELIEIGAIR